MAFIVSFEKGHQLGLNLLLRIKLSSWLLAERSIKDWVSFELNSFTNLRTSCRSNNLALRRIEVMSIGAHYHTVRRHSTKLLLF